MPQAQLPAGRGGCGTGGRQRAGPPSPIIETRPKRSRVTCIMDVVTEAVQSIMDSIGTCEIIVIDEIGKFTVESEGFVNAVRIALNADLPTLMTLHKKSRHPLLQDIRRRDDARILEVTPVNRSLLPYKIHRLVKEL